MTTIIIVKTIDHLLREILKIFLSQKLNHPVKSTQERACVIGYVSLLIIPWVNGPGEYFLMFDRI
jgi:hypothetical protein